MFRHDFEALGYHVLSVVFHSSEPVTKNESCNVYFVTTP
jgi:hypothetical protein